MNRPTNNGVPIHNKYIIVEDEFGKEVPILFWPSLIHLEVAGRRFRPVSAGFYKLVDGHVITFGESITLSLKSSPEDATLIARLLSSNL